ncbi:hypothetical protein BCR44DRAFT_1495130 [Catenaria anguillulae PL171]|uniref:Uncharacterized protein n=1 Tax=Catenaria anguillulae PL171 TaxID=765915 RepID=A0A1Y2I4B3_9FUNG|nr:hypothetical protein BCR44DRAFT_1495130 [Catenaria anguillulae PL171]
MLRDARGTTPGDAKGLTAMTTNPAGRGFDHGTGADQPDFKYSDNEDDGSDSDAIEDAAAGDDPAVIPETLTNHLVFPQNPNGNLPLLRHILNHWVPNTQSPWISVSYSLRFGVYYKCMADIMYEPHGTLTNEMRRALRFVRKFQERFARGELVVVRATRIVIPEQVLVRSMAWFEAILQTAAENGATVRFRLIVAGPYAGLPGWFSMIENPVQAWQDEVLDAVNQVEINDE